MDTFVISLLVQGVGSLILTLACGILYAYRPRPFFLCWLLAWGNLSVWQFLFCWLLRQNQLAAGAGAGSPWVGVAASVFLGWHLALWTLGFWLYRQHLAAAHNPPPVDRSRRSRRAPLLACCVLLAAAAAAMLLLVLLVPLPAASGVVSVIAAVVDGWAAFLLFRTARAPQRRMLLWPAVFLLLYAFQYLHYAAIEFRYQGTGTLPGYLGYSTFGDFLLQTFTGVGLIILLMDEDAVVLRDALQRLAESEDRFRLLFDYSGVGMALLSADGRILQANPALERFLGYGAGELHNRRLAELLHPQDDTQKRHVGVGPPADESVLYQREKRYLHKDGHSVWASILRVPVRDAAGRLRYHVGVLVDITERKRAEAALQVSEQRYRLRFQTALDGICVWDETGRIVDVNPALCWLLGYRRDEFLALSLREVAPGLQPRAGTPVAGCDRCETQLRRKDGTCIQVEISCASMELEGTFLVHCSCRDITERKQAEEALRQSEQTLREERDFSTQVLDATDALIVVLDPAGRIVRSNGKFARVSGYAEGEVRGRRLREVLGDGSVGGLLPSGEQPLRTCTGQQRLIAWQGATVKDAQGRLRYLIGTGLDVTEQRRLEDQLRQAAKMQLLGTLVGGIAHDFNNQLTAILANLGLAAAGVRNQGTGGPELSSLTAVLPYLLDAERAAQRCADMTRRLLTFSSHRVSQTQPVDLNQVVLETVRLAERVLPATIRVDTDLRPDLDAVEADSTQLHQVIMNLAVNARDAMPSGGRLVLRTANRTWTPQECDRLQTGEPAAVDPELFGRVRLVPGPLPPGRFVELTIRDTGHGMTAEVLERLFEPFFTTKEVGKGTGLGLPMVFGIVKGHGGRILVCSAPEAGSLFRIYLPAAGRTAGDAPLEASDVSASGPDPLLAADLLGDTPVATPFVSTDTQPAVPGGGQLVLVVDDEELIRTVAGAVLEGAGFRVLTAADGTEALAAYRSHLDPAGRSGIDLVLLDYTMPGRTGLEILHELRVLDPAVRVVFSTGYALDSTANQLLAAGAQAFVPKPYRPSELLHTVLEVLGQR
jgi:two-component system cell cycle sensor histidine kinase/response regulator CckA